jgi:hypothetical protein
MNGGGPYSSFGHRCTLHHAVLGVCSQLNISCDVGHRSDHRGGWEDPIVDLLPKTKRPQTLFRVGTLLKQPSPRSLLANIMPTLAIERLLKIAQFRNIFTRVGLDHCRKIPITLL